MSSWLETWRLLNKIVYEGEVFPLATRKAHRKVTQSDTHVNPTRHYLRTIELKISRNNSARPRVGWVNEKLLFIVIEKLETNMRRAEFLLPWPCVQCRQWTKIFFIDITPGSLSLRLPAWAGNRNGFYRRTNDNAAVSRKKLLIELPEWVKICAGRAKAWWHRSSSERSSSKARFPLFALAILINHTLRYIFGCRSRWFSKTFLNQLSIFPPT